MISLRHAGLRVGALLLAPTVLLPASIAAPAEATVAPASSVSAASTWKPGPARFGHTVERNVVIVMADGTALRADVIRPAVKGTATPAAGRFPVLLTMTPYGKSNYSIDTHLVHRGYIEVVVDTRGTGLSGGTFEIFSRAEVADGVALVRWASRLRGSTGKVGMIGGSYLGINQLLIAGAVGPRSALKAVFPVAAAHDLYRDVVTMGSIADFSFLSVWLLGLLPSQNLTAPLVEALTDPTSIGTAVPSLLRNLIGDLDYNAALIAKLAVTGEKSTDGPYWRDRSPRTMLRSIVANNVPAYLVGGTADIFQRGQPLNFAGLQNAWAGRAVDQSMNASQKVTGRYQLLLGPWTHVAFANLDLRDRQIAWYDRWLKGRKTGIDQTKRPLQVIDATTGKKSSWRSYPAPGTRVSTYYLGAGRTGTAPSSNDGALLASPPKVASAQDAIIWSPASSSVCSRATDQWLGGLPSSVLDGLGVGWGCSRDDRPAQTGPHVVTYTTPKFSRSRTIAGPIAARLYVTSSGRENQLVVTIDDVSPDGKSRPLTAGALLGSQRALDSQKSWTIDKRLVLPYHPSTSGSAAPLTPGVTTRFDVEVFATVATIKAGHRLRIQVASNDAPHLLPTLPQSLALLGGRYEIRRDARYPSSISVPTIG